MLCNEGSCSGRLGNLARFSCMYAFSIEHHSVVSCHSPFFAITTIIPPLHPFPWIWKICALLNLFFSWVLIALSYPSYFVPPSWFQASGKLSIKVSSWFNVIFFNHSHHFISSWNWHFASSREFGEIKANFILSVRWHITFLLIACPKIFCSIFEISQFVLNLNSW